MEEEGMDRKRKEWGIRRKMLIFGIVDILICISNQESESPEGK
jgi:hypothetical protein